MDSLTDLPAAPPTPAQDAREPAMVVVLSETTAAHVGRLIECGWRGSVLVVGSVAEAREALTGHAETADPRRDAELIDLRCLSLDGDRRRVVNPPAAASLTPLEFGLLERLLAQPGRVRSFADLTSTVWGTSYTGDCSHLHAVVRRLRTKLEAVGAPVLVAAVRGVGFRLAQAPTTPTRIGAVRLRGV